MLSRSKRPGSLPRSRRLTSTSSVSVSGQDADRRQQASIANAQLTQQDSLAKGQLALQDAQGRSQAAQFQAQYGLDRDANSRANIASQAALGQQLRGVDQQLRSAPVTSLGQQVDMFSGLPLSLFQGQTVDSNGSRTGTETTTGGTIGDWGSLLGGLGSLASGAGALKTALG